MDNSYSSNATSCVAELSDSAPSVNTKAAERDHRLDGKPTAPKKGDELCARLEKTVGCRFTSGNSVEVLIDGDEIFPAMLEAIRNARSHIRFLTYVYWEGEIAVEFAEAIVEKAKAGVTCHVLLDAFGSKRMRDDLRRMMEEAGAQVALYNTFSFSRIPEYQHRTHRKILVCDGDVGFIGGVGIADEWTGHAQDPEHWHDFHFRVTGPTIAGLVQTFDDDWNSPRVQRSTNCEPVREKIDRPSDETSHSAADHEGTANLEGMEVLPFYSTPRDRESEAFDAYLSLIESAEKRIRIITAYFIPEERMLRALSDAVARGVSVEIILPGVHCDSWLARRSSQEKWERVLDRGVRLFEYQPTMCHAKAAIFDDSLTTVGSINFDLLSLCLNDEANILVRSEEFASAMNQQWEADRERCVEILKDSWRQRGWWNRLQEKIAAKFPLPWWGAKSNY